MLLYLKFLFLAPVAAILNFIDIIKHVFKKNYMVYMVLLGLLAWIKTIQLLDGSPAERKIS